MLLLLEVGIIGVFLALDLFVFFPFSGEVIADSLNWRFPDRQSGATDRADLCRGEILQSYTMFRLWRSLPGGHSVAV